MKPESCCVNIARMPWFWKPIFFFKIILYLFAVIIPSFNDCEAATPQYHFVVKEAKYTRLCSSKKILTVNGEFPGPTIRARKDDTIFVMVHNKGKENITIHWHGVKQPRNPWADGPEYITQCPIQPGNKFNQKIVFSTEEGTVWWHAHSDWSRATVHGAIIVHPKQGTDFPFKKPILEFPIILGEWWKNDVRLVLEEFQRTGGAPNISDALTINGQPGDLYNCSSKGTVRFEVESRKRYLLRVVNAAMNSIMFFAVAHHNLTVIGSDGGYTKHLHTNYITISPGQTMDVLLVTDQRPGRYYMAARAYSSGANIDFDNTTTTAIMEYKQANSTTYKSKSSSDSPLLPYLPYYNDTNAAFSFITRLRSLASKEHPVDVPTRIERKIVTTVSINTFPCAGNDTCEGPNGTRLAASMNNISFVLPTSVDVLEAYYYHINGVYKNNFPRFPPYFFNFTGENLPVALRTPKRGTKAVVLPHGSLVEMVFQGTNLVAGLDHPMHLHGYNFFVVGYGFGNFDEEKDSLGFNLVDPPFLNTVIVPKNGWAVIRFAATNPGVWFMHCHLERHLTWGMNTVFIVMNGNSPNNTLKPPPPDMPPC